MDEPLVEIEGVRVLCSVCRRTVVQIERAGHDVRLCLTCDSGPIVDFARANIPTGLLEQVDTPAPKESP